MNREEALSNIDYYMSKNYIARDKVKNYIKDLEQENQRLKENNQAMQEEMTRTWKKLDVLKELKSWLKEQVESPKDFWSVMRINDILSKINKLEKSGYEI